MIFGNSFGDQLWGCGKQLALGQLPGPALGSRFREQLWEQLCEQLSGANCGAQLWADQLSMTPFGGQQLWETALGISFCGEHLVIWEELRIVNWY